MATPAESDPPPKVLKLKAAEFTRDNEPAGAPASSANDPLELLRVNREREKAQGFDEMPPPRKKLSRRHRDYLIGLVSVNLILGVLIAPLGPVGPIATMAFFTAGFSWVMLVVLDDY
jgi:hypothetical protein